MRASSYLIYRSGHLQEWLICSEDRHTSTSISARLGPLAAAFERLGVRSALLARVDTVASILGAILRPYVAIQALLARCVLQIFTRLIALVHDIPGTLSILRLGTVRSSDEQESTQHRQTDQQVRHNNSFVERTRPLHTIRPRRRPAAVRRYSGISSSDCSRSAAEGRRVRPMNSNTGSEASAAKARNLKS